MTDPLTAEPTGAISRTYLDSDLRKIGKAKSLGEGGGIVRLSPDQGVLEGLFVAEGIETALTVMALGLRPVWSTGSGTTMAKFSVITGIEALTILADNDASGAGERAAREVEARWRQAGKEVRIIMRDKVGDINDALKGQAAIALSPEENLILLGMREMQTLELLSEAAPISEDKPDFGGPAQEASLSRSRRFIDVRAIAGGDYPVEDPTQMSHRSKLSGRRRHHGASVAPQQSPLSFADPPTLAKALDGGPHGRRLAAKAQLAKVVGIARAAAADRQRCDG
jgi:Toprim domain